MKSLILECLESGAEVTLSVKAKDLKEFAQLLIDNAAKETTEKQRLIDEEVYYSTDEVMTKLKIGARSTIYRWISNSYLEPVKIGKKVMFRKSDIDVILNSGKDVNNG